MKKNFILALAASSLMFSCSDDDTNLNNSITSEALYNTLVVGDWTVTRFIEDGVDQTVEYTPYTLSFNNNGTLYANSNGDVAYDGSWYVESDDSDSDYYTNPDLHMIFPAGTDVSSLSEDWQPVERTNSMVRFTHVSGSDGSVDELTLELL